MYRASILIPLAALVVSLDIVAPHAAAVRVWDSQPPMFVRDIRADEANRILSDEDDASFAEVFNGRDFTGWAGALDNYES